MQGIERDQPASQAEFGEQRLGGRDLVGFLVDLAVHQRSVGGEHAEQVRGGSVTERVEAAAQGLAVDRQTTPARLGVGRLQQLGVATEGCFYRVAVQALQNVA